MNQFEERTLKELKRIADALERLAPPPIVARPGVKLTPEQMEDLMKRFQ